MPRGSMMWSSTLTMIMSSICMAVPSPWRGSAPAAPYATSHTVHRRLRVCYTHSLAQRRSQINEMFEGSPRSTASAAVTAHKPLRLELRQDVGLDQTQARPGELGIHSAHQGVEQKLALVAELY